MKPKGDLSTDFSDYEAATYKGEITLPEITFDDVGPGEQVAYVHVNNVDVSSVTGGAEITYEVCFDTEPSSQDKCYENKVSCIMYNS